MYELAQPHCTRREFRVGVSSEHLREAETVGRKRPEETPSPYPPLLPLPASPPFFLISSLVSSPLLSSPLSSVSSPPSSPLLPSH